LDRDIDTVIAILRRRYPDVVVQQLPVTHPGAARRRAQGMTRTAAAT
jgi:hypothetical protein